MDMEARAAANAPTDPMSQMAGGMLGQMFPPGGIDQIVIAGDKGVRSEQKADLGPIKAGMIMLMKPDGTQYVLDPVAKTYWKQPAMPPEVAGMLAQMNPKVTIGKRGIFETIDGMKCEHITMNMSMNIPGIDPSQMPPGMPSSLSLTYDVWLPETLKTPPAAASISMGMLKQFGFDQMEDLKKLSSDGRLMVKGVMSMFGIEMVMQTKDVKTEAVSADLFEIPKDYKEVPPPGL